MLADAGHENMEPAGSDVNQDCADTKLADIMEHGGLDDDALDRWTSEKSDSGSGRDDETGFEGTPHYAPAPLPTYNNTPCW